MKKHLLKSIFISLILLVGATNAWADGGIGYKGVKFTKDGTTTGWYNIHNVTWDYAHSSYECRSGKSGVTNFNNSNLGVVTSLKLHSFVVIGWTNNSDWVSGQLKYRTYLQSASAGNYNVYNVGNYETYCNATDVLVTSGNNRVVGKNGTMNITLVDDNTTPGKYYLQLQGMGRMRWCDGDFNANNGSEVKASYTVPGFTTTSTSQTFDNTTVNSNSSKTISFDTHYGTSLTTNNCVISGTNASEFSVTNIDESNVIVKFTPTTAGNKSATLTITDAHEKKCTITLSGTATVPTYTVTFDVHSSGNGTLTAEVGSTGINSSTKVDQGSLVVFTAVPSPGYQVEGWYSNSECTTSLNNGTNAKYTINSLTAEANVYVKFEAIPANNHNITYTDQGTGWTYGTTPASAEEGTTVTFVVNPTTGYTVSVTSDDVTLNKNENEYTFTMPTKDVAIKVSATENTNNVSVSYKCGDETIKADATVETVGEVTPTSVTAPEIDGYAFASWTLGSGIQSANTTANPISITTKASGDYTLTANYTKMVTVYLINNSNWANVYAYGWKNGEDKGTPAWPGAKITANKLAEKYEGYDVYSYKVKEGSYDNVIFNNGSGIQTETFAWTDGKYYYAVDPLGSDVYLAGEMTNWATDKIEFKKATAEATTASVTVNLTAKTYKFKLIIGEGNWRGNTGTMKRGGNAVHEGGWSFEEEGGDDKNCQIVADIAGDYTFTWNLTDKKLTVAYPALPKHQVSASVNPTESGTIEGVAEYEQGTYATLTATAAEGYKFVNWTKGENVVSTEAKYKFIVNEPVELVANFERVHDVKISCTCNGVEIQSQTQKIGEATQSTITAPSIENYTFISWEVGDGITVVENKNEKISILTKSEGNYVLTANYERIARYLTGNDAVFGMEGESTWHPNKIQMEWDEASKKYTHTVAGLAAKKYYKFRITDGTWDGKWGYSNLQPAIDNVFAAEDNNISFVLSAAGDLTIAFDGTNIELTTTSSFAAPVYTIVGDAAITGCHWDVTSVENQMVQDATDKNKYTLVKTVRAVAGEYDYKGIRNYSYDWEVAPGNKLNIDKDGTGKITYTLDISTKQLTADVSNWEEEVVAHEVTLVGIGENKNFSEAADRKTTSVAVDLEANSVYTFEIIVNSVYMKNNGIMWRGNCTDWTFKSEENNAHIVTDLAGTYTFTWTYDGNKLSVTYPEGSNVPAPIFLGGEMNGWDWTKTLLIPSTDSKTASAIVNLTEAKKYEFKIRQGDDHLGNNGTMTRENNNQAWTFAKADNNCTITADIIGDYVFTWNYEKSELIVTYPEIVTPPTIIGEGENNLNDGEIIDVQVNRQFATGNIYTLSLPFALDNVEEIFGNGTSVYQFSALTKNASEELVLYFDKVTSIAAATPYLIEPAQAVDGFTVENATISTTPNNISFTVDATKVTMKPILSATAGSETNGEYWLAADRYLYNNVNTLLSLRALFNISTVSGMPPRCRVALGENAETGVDNIINGENTTIKVIENGQLIIIRDGIKYNAQGQKL